MTTPKKKQVNCKHNAGRGYWNISKGFMCLKCGEECIEENGKIKLL